MNLVYQHPVSLWEQMQRDAEQVLNRVAQLKKAEAAESNWMPNVDIQEQADHYLVAADIPGVDPKQIDISVDKNVLTIKGERQAAKAEQETGFKRVERVLGQFQRRFTLPDNADADKISATGENGVLFVRIPKQEAVEPRKITVQ
ncbi:Hsp20/alpha crystallin family protein [Candidatus Albibeggiatoa sp. nov. NOAA]|uniref:Hsp20/alpha crystallin family protein n=1 Tax=Candidatus Albibeggiatoa sp. nov. NOAA TaxID=3162724 RepID=UPI0032FF6E5C|nr:Hsp20/alpha crystallin family protein [Thiotrichaceae bacterium]